MELESRFSSEEIAEAVARVAEEISADYQDEVPLLVGILTGSFVFLADLVRAMTVPVEIDFIRARSYGKGTVSSGAVEITKDIDMVSQVRSEIGTQVKALEKVISDLSTQIINDSGMKSRITDANMAEEFTALAKLSVIEKMHELFAPQMTMEQLMILPLLSSVFNGSMGGSLPSAGISAAAGLSAEVSDEQLN